MKKNEPTRPNYDNIYKNSYKYINQAKLLIYTS
jgi:hypothetical protein